MTLQPDSAPGFRCQIFGQPDCLECALAQNPVDRVSGNGVAGAPRRHALPIHRQHLERLAKVPGAIADRRPMSQIRALIVDDSSVMRKIVERTLRQAGLELETVLEASNGNEGLDLLQKQKVDVILSDINMPSMDGLEFLRQLRSRDLAPKTPVVMVTTEGSEEQVKQAIQAGAQGYIRKPFTVEQIKQRVIPLVRAA